MNQSFFLDDFAPGNYSLLISPRPFYYCLIFANCFFVLLFLFSLIYIFVKGRENQGVFMPNDAAD